ncbi:MAG: formate dehydrogenase, partial [Candidatus Syntrophonatronum acetioxidans]
EGGAFPNPILEMNWDYGDDPDPVEIAMEINGYYVEDGSLLPGFGEIASLELGETAAGSWIYTGFFQDEDDPNTKRRIKETEGIGANLEYTWAWPANRRIVYNRASCDGEGNPWNPDRPVVWWEDGEWKLNDVPDFNANVPPEETANNAFIMNPEGQSRFFAAGMVEGPFTEHYEPWESITRSPLTGDVEFNPCCEIWYPEDRGSDADYPYICTTYRVVEHYQTAIETRNQPWLVEAMPEMFCEISLSLAAELGVENGDMVEIESKRGTIQCKACVTPRVKPLMINGEEKEIVGMPWHWGHMGLSTGASANDLSPTIGCANTTIPEFKSFICNIRRAG